MSTPPIQLMIAGAQKSGTSSLIRYASQHPEIAVHDSLEFPFFMLDELYDQGYEETFTRLYHASYTEGKKVVAKHAMLMYSDTACNRMYEHNPNAVIVLMLRNPIRRAYSAYWHGRRRGYESAETFEDALKLEHIDSYDDWFEIRKTAYVYNGIYAPHVKHLRQTFGTDNVLVYTTEDLRYDPLILMREIFERTGVDSTFKPDMIERHNTAAKPRSTTIASMLGRIKASHGNVKQLARKVLPQSLVRQTLYMVGNLNDAQFTPPPMNPETYNSLAEHFRAANLELSELLNRDLSSWNDIPPEFSLVQSGSAVV